MEDTISQFGKMMKSATLKIREQATDFMDRGTPLEKTLREATANTNWGCSTTILAEIARASFDYNDYFIIMKTVWECLSDKPSKWRRVFKTLTLLEYLIRNGSERVVDEARESVCLHRLRSLMDFHYTEQGADKGTGIQKKAKELYEMLNDNQLLKEEREKARRNRDKFVGIGAHGERSGAGYTYSTNFEKGGAAAGGYDRRSPDSFYAGGRYDPWERRSPGCPSYPAAAGRHAVGEGGARRSAADLSREQVMKEREADRLRAEQERDRARKQRERQKEKTRIQRQIDEDAVARRRGGDSSRRSNEGRSDAAHRRRSSDSRSDAASDDDGSSSSLSSSRSDAEPSDNSRRVGDNQRRRRTGTRGTYSTSSDSSRASSDSRRRRRQPSSDRVLRSKPPSGAKTARISASLLDVESSPTTSNSVAGEASYVTADAGWTSYSAAPPMMQPQHSTAAHVAQQQRPRPPQLSGAMMPDFFAAASTNVPPPIPNSTGMIGGSRPATNQFAFGAGGTSSNPFGAAPSTSIDSGNAAFSSSSSTSGNFLNGMPQSLFDLNLTASAAGPTSSSTASWHLPSTNQPFATPAQSGPSSYAMHMGANPMFPGDGTSSSAMMSAFNRPVNPQTTSSSGFAALSRPTGASPFGSSGPTPPLAMGGGPMQPHQRMNQIQQNGSGADGWLF